MVARPLRRGAHQGRGDPGGGRHGGSQSPGGRARPADALSEAGIKTDFGLLAAEAEALNPGFFKRMRTAFPLVTVKLGRAWMVAPPWRVARASGSPLRRRAGTCSGCGPVTMRCSPAPRPCWRMAPPLTVRWDELPPRSGGLSQRDPAPATAGHRGFAKPAHPGSAVVPEREPGTAGPPQGIR